ncbi:ferredoxin [Parafrankia sp. EUN1f]|uniref:ferredoxin n=1 Tax=Parafrankia sp. EUN1f TaxID=102897 RepID=UPI0001C45B0D|nr:ferredoxin [Parafrankia sp. EUN1f]EFC81809.1 ferredoxin reductase [Parafrankia sp. EUN1f]
MKVTVDLDKCEQNALCTGIAPTVFELSPDDHLTVLDDNPDDDLTPSIRAAAAACPRQAILLTGA